MPNWCSNELTVKGPAEELALFVSKIENSEGLLSALFPMPESLKEASKGTDEFSYNLYYGEIPDYAFGWVDIKESGIAKDDPEVREKLIALFEAQDKPRFTKKDADLYKYNLEAYGFKSWYGWAIANWGTKWDVPTKDGGLSITYKQGDEGLYVSFDTAWGPPLEWMDTVSLDWPKLTMLCEYSELGMWFAGYKKVLDGNVLAELSDEADAKDQNGNPLFEFCADEVEHMIRVNEGELS
jgi:hypothetical protein